MKTVFGKLAGLIVLLIAGLLLFAPMRTGTEDHLYAYPRSIRMNRGDAFALTYVLHAENRQEVTFSSTDEQVVTVTPQGQITAVSPGQAQIHMTTAAGAKAMVLVEVTGSPATALTLNAEALTMEKGQVTGLQALFNADADDRRVQWVSDNPQVASVDKAGRVRAVGGGQARVTASTPNGLSASAQVYVHVAGTAIVVTPAEVTVGQGAALRMGSYYLPEDTTDEVTRWVSSDANILTIDDDGSLLATGEGLALVRVFTRDGLSGETSVTVERAADDFEISPAAATIERGTALSLEPRFMDASGRIDETSSAHYIAWESNNPEVASVEDGVVTALSSGFARITASADGKTAICNLRVQVLVHAIELNLEEVYLLREQADRPIQLEAALIPADPDDATIVWSSNNELVATVSQDGLVTPTGGYGTAIITARAQSGAEAHFTLNIVTQIPEEALEEGE